ncbi:hypothetical protein VTN31DRAFT_1117 [Thermomyces dupontii]|uniref:uncharacterized protein n=1 Tax=Talaromyces thermophilus TaxID=28565 RepID=UPI003743B60E
MTAMCTLEELIVSEGSITYFGVTPTMLGKSGGTGTPGDFLTFVSAVTLSGVPEGPEDGIWLSSHWSAALGFSPTYYWKADSADSHIYEEVSQRVHFSLQESR